MPPPPINNPLLALLTQGGQAQQPQLPQLPNIPGQGQIPRPQQGPPQIAPQMPQAGPQQAPVGASQIPNLGVRAGMGSQMSDQMSQIGGMAPTPPINPVVETFDNAPPIVREAIRRRLFTQGM